MRFFCAGFLLNIPFGRFIYILISLIIRFIWSEIHKFMNLKQFLQLKCVLMIYKHIKSIYTNYMMYVEYTRNYIDNLHDALLMFLVDESGGSNNHCFFDINVSF